MHGGSKKNNSRQKSGQKILVVDQKCRGSNMKQILIKGLGRNVVYMVKMGQKIAQVVKF